MKAFGMALLLAFAAATFPDAAKGQGSPDGSALVESSRSVFLEKCSRCHEAERGYRVIGDWPAWVLTAARMAIKDRDWITPDSLKRIIAYGSLHATHRNMLFEERCGGCHRWEGLGQLGKTASQWRTWVRFMAGRHGAEVTLEECELLVTGLAGESRTVVEGANGQGDGREEDSTEPVSAMTAGSRSAAIR